MNSPLIDLKAFRESNHLTQAGLAQILGVRQDTISRLEKDPDQITVKVLMSLAAVSGQSPDQLMRYHPQAQEELAVERVWTGHLLAAALKSKIASFREAMPDTKRYAPESWELLNRLERIISSELRKPTIGVMGGAASGKSTLINVLLGQWAIPTDAGFGIPVPIRIKHIEDRPSSMEDSVYILGKGSGEAGEEEPPEQRILAGGGPGTLSDWGSCGNYKRRLSEVDSVLIYLDSDILKNCDVVEFPSLPGKSWAGTQVDILVYLLPVTGIVGAMETLNCKAALDSLWVEEQYDRKSEPLSNLFFVVSKAHLAGSMEKAREVMQEIGEYIYSTVPPSFWQLRERLTGRTLDLETFLSRFFIYTTFTPQWCEDFEREFRRSVETLPRVFEQAGIQEVDNYRNMACRILDADLQRGRKEQCEDNRSLVSRVESGEADNWAAVTQKRDKVLDAIRSCKRSSQDAFSQYYRELLNDPVTDSSIPDDSTQQCSSAQLQQVGSLLNSKLERQMREILLQTGRSLSEPLDEYLTAFEERVSGSGFLVQKNYIEALRRDEPLGAMAWRTAAQDVGLDPELLRTAGEVTQKYVSGESELRTYYKQDSWEDVLSVGRGMPVVLGAVLSAGMSLAMGAGAALVPAVASALAAENLTKRSKLQTKIVKVYTREDVLEKYSLCIEHYWEDTLSAFRSASDQLEQNWRDYFDRLSKDIQEGGETMAKRTQAAESVKNFLELLSI